MADDWIKMRGGLTEHPKLVAMSRALHSCPRFRDWLSPYEGYGTEERFISKDALRCVTCALLLRVWSRAREHGIFRNADLVLPHNTVEDLDQLACAPSVGRAMLTVGWAVESNGITLPNFLEFNVPRTNAERQKDWRERSKTTVTKPLRTSRNNRVTREEKRREENTKEDLRLPFGSVEFADAWKEWLAYRSERRLPAYKPTGLKAQFKRLASFGEAASIECINLAIAQGWQGIPEPKAQASVRQQPTGPDAAMAKLRAIQAAKGESHAG